MTPFGEKMRQMRAERQVTQKQMAHAIGVSSAYLSALEHGKRGRPSWYLIQRIINYFNVIWDDADRLVELAHMSHPRISIDTSGLSPKATAIANHLADQVASLHEHDLDALLDTLKRARDARASKR